MAFFVELPMLTFEDCIALCELTDEEVAAIAEHEHLPMTVAAELGNYLIHGADGAPRIKRMIVDDIAAAERRGDRRHTLALKLVLRHFVEHHPVARQHDALGRRRDHAVREFLKKVPAAPTAPAAA
jgi:hypothetical protein